MEKEGNGNMADITYTPKERKLEGNIPVRNNPYAPPPPPSAPPIYPPPYYPQQPPPPQMQPMYSWELFPFVARELMKEDGGKKPAFTIIGTFLLVTAIFALIISGMFVFYATADEIDFGGTVTLSGKVQSEDGTNISGATISIIGTDLSSRTDRNGYYRINNAPNGIWKVRVSRPGYTESVHKILIHADFADTIDFRLEEGDGESEINELWFFFSLAIIMTIFSCFVLAGSYYAFSGKRFSMVLVGSILGIFSSSVPIFFWFISPIFIMSAAGLLLSFLALFISITNRKAFKTLDTEPEEG
jgi:hypothetical protein